MTEREKAARWLVPNGTAGSRRTSTLDSEEHVCFACHWFCLVLLTTLVALVVVVDDVGIVDDDDEAFTHTVGLRYSDTSEQWYRCCQRQGNFHIMRILR